VWAPPYERDFEYFSRSPLEERCFLREFKTGKRLAWRCSPCYGAIFFSSSNSILFSKEENSLEVLFLDRLSSPSGTPLYNAPWMSLSMYRMMSFRSGEGALLLLNLRSPPPPQDLPRGFGSACDTRGGRSQTISRGIRKGIAPSKSD